MTYLKLRISDLILKDSLEYASLTDSKKIFSIEEVIKFALRTSKNERADIVSVGGGYRV